MNTRRELLNRNALCGSNRIHRIKTCKARVGIDNTVSKIPIPRTDTLCRVKGEFKALFALAQLFFNPYPLGGLDGRDEHAADTARRGGIGNRAVRDGEPRFLPLCTVALDGQWQIGREKSGASASENRLMERSQSLLNLRPCLTKRQAECPGMLVGKNGPVSVVVDQDEIRAPSNGHGKSRRHHDADNYLKTFGPRLHRAEWCCGPIVGLRQRCHLADHGRAGQRGRRVIFGR